MTAAKPDCTGQRFGMLTVVSRGEVRVSTSGRKNRTWVLICDCGNTVEMVRGSFDRKIGSQKSCGCLRHQHKGAKPKDITGLRFGSLTAIRPTGDKDARGKPTWHLKCDCGGAAEMSCSRLGLGFRLNCGDLSHNPGLHYPPMPNPMPIPVDRLVAKYLKYTQPEWERYDSAIQDEKINRLIRASWIVFYRRSQGEDISEQHERRLILKTLRYARATVRTRRFVEAGGVCNHTFSRFKPIGIEMTHSTSFTEAVSAHRQTQPGSVMSKRRRFQRR